jgi:hypothetical protein
VTLEAESLPTMRPNACNVALDRSAPGFRMSSTAAPTKATSAAVPAKTASTRKKRRDAPPSRNRRCRLNITAEIMNGKVVIFRKSTYTSPISDRLRENAGR